MMATMRSNAIYCSVTLFLLFLVRPVTMEAVSLKTAEKLPSQNLVEKSVGLVKDYTTRFYDGFKQMRTDHVRCSKIRSKQNDYRQELKAQWTAEGVEKSVINQRLKTVNGGITFEEYAFLQKGKTDRNKLMNLAFYSLSIRSMWPYLLWFGPDAVLPAKIRPMTTEEKEASSRHRAHSVWQALLEFEHQGNAAPGFMGGKERKKLHRMQDSAMSILSSLDEGPGSVLEMLDTQIYSSAAARAKDNLVALPKVITKGLAAAVSGKRQNFGLQLMRRFQVLNHIKRLKDCDEFLVQEKVDLSTINNQLLVQTCSDRLIGISGRSDGEMQQNLQDWLHHAVVLPAEKTEGNGFQYNGLLARSALMCYFALKDTVDERSSSVLPRLLYGVSEPDDDALVAKGK